MKIKATISPEFAAAARQDYRLAIIEANVVNSETPEQLTDMINRLADSMAQIMEVADIYRRPAIAATREAYKRFGKDPNRYRPSQEQMSRRVLKGLGLYTVNTLADIGNLMSLKSGNSVGVFDADKISGDTLILGIGRENEPYEGIGRGPLNVEGLPIVRDNIGGIGTPTSDNERTKVDLDTRRVVITIHCFAQEMPLPEVVNQFTELLTEHCSATSIDCDIIAPSPL